jgi:hypothetical protein
LENRLEHGQSKVHGGNKTVQNDFEQPQGLAKGLRSSTL